MNTPRVPMGTGTLSRAFGLSKEVIEMGGAGCKCKEVLLTVCVCVWGGVRRRRW